MDKGWQEMAGSKEVWYCTWLRRRPIPMRHMHQIWKDDTQELAQQLLFKRALEPRERTGYEDSGGLHAFCSR